MLPSTGVTGSPCSTGELCRHLQGLYRLVIVYGRTISPPSGVIQSWHVLRQGCVTTYRSYRVMSSGRAASPPSGIMHGRHGVREGCHVAYRSLQELQGRHVLREGCVTAFRSRSLINNAHGSPETKPVFAEKKRKTFTCFITVIRNSN